MPGGDKIDQLNSRNRFKHRHFNDNFKATINTVKASSRSPTEGQENTDRDTERKEKTGKRDIKTERQRDRNTERRTQTDTDTDRERGI